MSNDNEITETPLANTDQKMEVINEQETELAPVAEDTTAANTAAFVVTEEYLQARLAEAVQFCKKKEYDAAESIFSDLMIHAVKFYKSETHLSMSKFFYFYGDMLLSKLESNPDVFGEQAQKKITPDATTGEVPTAQTASTQEKPAADDNQKMIADPEEGGEEGDEEDGQPEEADEVVQLDTLIFKDENVEIRDETKDENNEETEAENNGALSGVAKVHVDPVDDLQLAWEHLELSRRIYTLELEEIKNSATEDKKIRHIQTIKQIIEISLRIGDLESWRDNLTEAVSEYTKALELSKEVEDRETSRNLGSIYFQLGNAILYENKELCEDEALRNFLESLQILENCLSAKLQIPPNELPSFKVLQKEDLRTGHLKHSFLDDEESKSMKDILKGLYDKVEDTLIQRDERDKYKKYQELMKQQAQNQNQFAQPTAAAQAAPVKNLGTFGSLKRKEPQQSEQQQQQPSTESQQENQASNSLKQVGADGQIEKQIKPSSE